MSYSGGNSRKASEASKCRSPAGGSCPASWSPQWGYWAPSRSPVPRSRIFPRSVPAGTSLSRGPRGALLRARRRRRTSRRQGTASDVDARVDDTEVAVALWLGGEQAAPVEDRVVGVRGVATGVPVVGR